MQAIIFTVAIIGTFASSTLEAARDVARPTENANDTAVANVLKTNSGSGNQTLFENNGTNVAPPFDLGHPIAAVEALYENSRERIHLWMVDFIVLCNVVTPSECLFNLRCLHVLNRK